MSDQTQTQAQTNPTEYPQSYFSQDIYKNLWKETGSMTRYFPLLSKFADNVLRYSFSNDPSKAYLNVPWVEAERITNEESVHEALFNFQQDPTHNNAVCLVRLVLAARIHPATTSITKQALIEFIEKYNS